MKCKALFFSFVFCTMLAQGQNLVPNPSFEEYTECPASPLELNIIGAYPWTSFRQTPDFFHPCDETGVMSSPYSSTHGYGVPYHGQGKGGFIAAGGSFNREILGVELTDTLIIGESYYISFQVLRTFGGGAHANCNCACSHIGLKFTTRSYNILETVPIDNRAHILHEGVVVDSTNWTQVSGWVVADSAYTHLAIGTFFDNDHIVIENYNNYPMLPNTYYFVDAVCVSTDPADCDAFRPVGIVEYNSTPEVTVFPNPALSVLNISSQRRMGAFKVFDITGSPVADQYVNHNHYAFDTRLLSKGLYIVVVQFENGDQHNLSFIKQ